MTTDEITSGLFNTYISFEHHYRVDPDGTLQVREKSGKIETFPSVAAWLATKPDRHFHGAKISDMRQHRFFQ